MDSKDRGSSFERTLASRLAQLEKADRLRRPNADLETLVDFASNDYLGIGCRARSTSGAWSARASRLVRGNSPEVRALEARLAGWLGTEAALVFSSGYSANVGLISSLAERGDLIVSDALNHASIIDGCRLSRAEILVVPHLDFESAERALRDHQRTAGRRWIVTESYFGMDADGPDLRRLRPLADAFDAALLVDEAHALGVYGPRGTGLVAEAGVTADALMGTFGKALGGMGAFVAGSQTLIDWLWNRARSFVFSTGVAPSVAASNLAALEEAIAADSEREKLHRLAATVRAGLGRAGYPALGTGAILPILLRDDAACLAAQRAAQEAGLHLQGIRPPTASPRLRVTLHATQTEEEVERLLRFCQEELARFGRGQRPL